MKCKNIAENINVHNLQINKYRAPRFKNNSTDFINGLKFDASVFVTFKYISFSHV